MTALTFRNRNNNNDGLSILDEMFNGWRGLNEIYHMPVGKSSQDRHSPNVRELEDRFEISLAAPGLDKKDFSISVEGNKIIVSYDASEKEEHYAYATKYSKSYTLSSSCDAEKISASYKNGVLVVDIPKAPNAQPRVIKIK